MADVVVPILLVIAAVAVILQLALVLLTAQLARTVERKLPAPGRFLDVAGARLHYVEQGEGPAVVLVHGLSGSANNFTYSLFSHLKGRRFVALDRPGAGYSIAPAGWKGLLADQAAVVAGVIEGLGLGRPLVVGHSLGGAISLQLALDRPDLVSGLVLIAPLTAEETFVPPPFRKLAIRQGWLRWWFSWTLNVPVSIIQGKAALRWLFGPEEAPADFATRGGGVLGLIPRNYRGAAGDLLAVEASMPALVARLPELKCDVTVAFSPDDRILSADAHGVALALAVPQARYRTVAGGHMLPVSQPDRIAEIIAEADVSR